MNSDPLRLNVQEYTQTHTHTQKSEPVRKCSSFGQHILHLNIKQRLLDQFTVSTKCLFISNADFIYYKGSFLNLNFYYNKVALLTARRNQSDRHKARPNTEELHD